MINFIETLFGAAVVSVVAALILHWKGKRFVARRVAMTGGVCFVLALLLELYVRYLA
jgi:hypothetical protein